MANRPGSNEQLLRLAIATAKEGNRDGARVMLQQVLTQDARNDRAWTWLAYVEDDPIQRQQYLERAVQINPSNRTAVKALNKIRNKKARQRNRTLIYGSIVLIIMAVMAALACVVAFNMN